MPSVRRHVRLLLPVLALAALLVVAAPAATSSAKDPCANRLCTKYKKGTPSCWRFEKRRTVSRCFISRAARHFGQSRRQATAIAFRESRLNYKVTNPSSGTAGLFQFAGRTWRSTPYGRRSKSPYHPKWAALGAMWMWSKGGYSQWAL